MSTVKTTAKGTSLPILKLRGKDYLEVKWRLVWFREEHPDWSIETKIVHHDLDKSVVSARIFNELGRVIATGHKQEDRKGFADHLEKAETGSIGRALALCGYGTQFDGGDLEEGERLADAPVAPATPKVAKITKQNVLDHIKDRMKALTNNYQDKSKAKLIYREMGVTGWSELQKLTLKDLQDLAKMVA